MLEHGIICTGRGEESDRYSLQTVKQSTLTTDIVVLSHCEMRKLRPPLELIQDLFQSPHHTSVVAICNEQIDIV